MKMKTWFAMQSKFGLITINLIKNSRDVFTKYGTCVCLLATTELSCRFSKKIEKFNTLMECLTKFRVASPIDWDAKLKINSSFVLFNYLTVLNRRIKSPFHNISEPHVRNRDNLFIFVLPKKDFEKQTIKIVISFDCITKSSQRRGSRGWSIK